MYEWTAEQLRQVGPGCTVDYVYNNGERVNCEVERADGDWFDIGEFGNDYARHFDPSTLLPPTLATLNRMAVESFGGESFVSDIRGPIDVCTRDEYGRRCERATFYEPDAARECARWLAARGR